MEAILKCEIHRNTFYNFNSIPHTVLVNKEGMIIASGLRGSQLEQKLKELLTK